MNLRSIRPAALLSATTLGLLAALVSAGPADAARNIETGFADALYRQGDTPATEQAFATTVHEGADLVRIDVLWRATATGQPAAPRDPSDPAYDFAALDGAVSAASARGLDILFTVYTAPDWAEGPDRPPASADASPAGTWRPDPAKFADFATALATRYSGKYTPPGAAGPLPAVNDFEAWNEENLWVYLSSQYEGKKLVSVKPYREMLNAFYDAIHGVNSNANVVLGGLAPYGDPPTPPPSRRVRPVLFLRELFCLTRGLKPLSCPDPAKFDTLGVHPINLSGGPNVSAVDPDDASSADIPSLTEVLHAAEESGTVEGGRHAVWATEFWWESFPDTGATAKPGLAKHGIWIEQALYIFWKAGVRVAINLQLNDTPATEDEFLDTYQAGIFLADGTPKPAATSFRFPFVLDREDNKQAFVWGKSPLKGKLAIEKKSGGGWTKVKTVSVKHNKVFTTTLDARGKGKYRATVGDETSLVWTLRN